MAVMITTQPVSARALFKQSTIKGDEAVLQFTVRMDGENAFPPYEEDRRIRDPDGRERAERHQLRRRDGGDLE